MPMDRNVKAFIFDFGNVIIDIDFDLTHGKFRNYFGKQYDTIINRLKESKFFEKVESGVYTAEKMTEVINAHGGSMTVNQVKESWNALLLNIPAERLLLLEQLSKKYPIYMLSNTNLVHIDEIFTNLEKEYGCNPILNCFDRLYLSYEIGYIKPQKEIYEYLLNDANLNPKECLFFDDLQENLNGAASFGIQTQLITKDYGIMDYFDEHLILDPTEVAAVH